MILPINSTKINVSADKNFGTLIFFFQKLKKFFDLSHLMNTDCLKVEDKYRQYVFLMTFDATYKHNNTRQT